MQTSDRDKVMGALQRDLEGHSAAPVKHSMSGRGTCKVCGRPVESRTLKGIYRHA